MSTYSLAFSKDCMSLPAILAIACDSYGGLETNVEKVRSGRYGDRTLVNLKQKGGKVQRVMKHVAKRMPDGTFSLEFLREVQVLCKIKKSSTFESSRITKLLSANLNQMQPAAFFFLLCTMWKA